MRRSNLLVAVGAAAAAVVLVTMMASLTAHAATTRLMQILAPVFTKNTQPTKTWIGLPEGYKFDPYVDLEHTDDRIGTVDPWSAEGQYGTYMGIQDNTINDFGCGPNGPLDCQVGTTPSQHFRSKKVQILSPLPTKNTVPDRTWNGLPEGFKFDPFVDLEHPDDRIGTVDPWSAEGQYGTYMGIQDNTINDWGCGPDGPLNCFVGTTPSQHFVRRLQSPSLRKRIA